MIEVTYSNEGLAPWHGAMTLISGDKVEIRLRKAFKKKRRYLFLYDREEILAHEMIHARRKDLDEPKFEEFLAYQTSPNAFRRLVGPIIESPRESWLFLLTLVGPLISNWLIPLPILLLGLGVTRLIRRHRAYRRCLKKLGGDFEKMVMMTDAEIIAGVMSPA